MSEAMDELPIGWVTVAIGDVTESKIEQQGPIGEGEFTYVDISSVDNVTKAISDAKRLLIKDAPSRARQRIRSGDVLVSTTRPNLNAVAMVPPDLHGAIASTGFAVLRSIEVEPDWLFAHVRSDAFINSMSELVRGALYPAVNGKEVRDYKIALPPFPEQRRIVAKIEALQARSRKARAALEAIPTLLEQFRQSVLSAAFRGDLTADWREQHPDVEPASVLLERIRAERRHQWEQAELAKFKAKGKVPKDDSWKERYVEAEPVDDSELPELPEGWCWATADDVCRQITDGEHIQPKYQRTGFPMLTAKHVRDGYVTFDDAGLIDEAEFRKCIERCKPTEGDILIVSVGATMGRTAIVGTSRPFALVRSVLLLKPILNSRYMLAWTKSPWCFDWMTRASGATAQAPLYIGATRRMPIPVSPADEQAEILRIITTIFNRRTVTLSGATEALKALSLLDQAVLAKAFRGELVAQDPNDEPASVLLERIKAERAESATGKPSRGRRKRTSNAAAEKTASDAGDVPAASNGKPQSVSLLRRPIDDYATDVLMPYFRSALRGAHDLTEDDLLRDIAQRLGFERLGPQVRATLEGHLRAALRRGIAERDGDFLRAATPTFQRYTDEQLFKTFTSVMRPGHEYDREEVIRAIAKHLGYTQVTPAMRTRMKSIFNMAIRRNLLTRRGPSVVAR